MTADANPDTCPRCGGGFVCGMSGPAPCPCTKVKVDEATLAQLRQTFSGCICLSCLAQVAKAAQTAAPTPADC